VNPELSVKKPSDKKPKEDEEPTSKKGEVRKQSIKIKKPTLQQQQTTSSKVPHNAKEPAGQRKLSVSNPTLRKLTAVQ